MFIKIAGRSPHGILRGASGLFIFSLQFMPYGKSLATRIGFAGKTLLHPKQFLLQIQVVQVILRSNIWRAAVVAEGYKAAPLYIRHKAF